MYRTLFEQKTIENNEATTENAVITRSATRNETRPDPTAEILFATFDRITSWRRVDYENCRGAVLWVLAKE